MRILHIEDFFHPDAGYQVNILSKYQAARGNEVIIITSEIEKYPEKFRVFFGNENIKERDNEFTARSGVTVKRVPVFGNYSGRAIYKPGLFRLVRSLKADILFIHGNDSFAGIVYTLFARRLKLPVIMDNHMLEMATVNRFNRLFRWAYRRAIAPLIIRNNIPVIRVVSDDFIIRNHGIPERLAPLIPLGTDTLLFYPDAGRREQQRLTHSISPSDFVVLYMGKISQDKNIELLADCFIEKFNAQKNILLVMVGNTSSEYGGKIAEILGRAQNRVIMYPTQKYQDMADFYRLADIVIYPRHCSMSFYDAQACGTPVLAEENTINAERLNNGNGILFRPGDINDLRDKINFLAELEEENFRAMQEASLRYITSNRFSYSFILNEYDKIIEERIRVYNNSMVTP